MQPAGGHLEPGGVEDLAADVGVQPEQLEPVAVRRGCGDRLGGLAAGEREAELLVLVGGRDELVGVRLDADGDADHDRRADAELGGDGGEPVDLLERVDDDPAHAVARAPGGSRRATCCCRATRSAPRGSRPAARPRAHRPSRRRGTGPRRRPSAPPRCTGTPCRRRRRRPRRARRTARRTRRGRPAPGRGSRPRRRRMPRCRTRARCSHVETADGRRPCSSRPTVCGQSCGTSSMTSEGHGSQCGGPPYPSAWRAPAS